MNFQLVLYFPQFSLYIPVVAKITRHSLQVPEINEPSIIIYEIDSGILQSYIFLFNHALYSMPKMQALLRVLGSQIEEL